MYMYTFNIICMYDIGDIIICICIHSILCIYV